MAFGIDSGMAVKIERLAGMTDEVIAGLSELLVATVNAGGSVSFMAGLTESEAKEWGRKTFPLPARGAALLARDSAGIVGVVLLQPSWAPNQKHRADVAKLMVHPRARGQGIARALMTELETTAKGEGFTLLLLDTVKGDAAERLYASMAWTRAGEVPNYALDPFGRPCTTVFFYKQL